MLLEHAIEVHAAPDRIWDFFERMEDNYAAWHPDHMAFRWIEGRGLREGVVFSFEERMAGRRQRKRVRFTHIEPLRRLEFAPTSRLFRLFLPRLAFLIEPLGSGICLFRAEIVVRLPPISRWLHRKEFVLVRRHMAEEGENLKRILERPALSRADPA